jgi:YHS domain-containing protein
MKVILPLLMLSVMAHIAAGQTDILRTQHYNLKRNIAVEGYDAVSYFDGRPKEGDPKIKSVHQGVTYLFSTPANLVKFKSNPHKYEPAYGGWCAYAMGETGEKVKIDPQTFKVLNGKLYLFYNFWGSNTLKDWEKNERKLKEAADHNWKNVVR